jgi:hypothetical protein
MIRRNTYIGDPLYSWDFRLSRNFHIRERLQMNFAFDAFNLLNRPNVDEVTSVYASPVFCGNVPQHYNDGTTRAIQQSSSSVACPVSTNGLAIPGIGSFARTPITDTKPPGTSCFPTAGPPALGPDSSCLFIPANPNSTFGLPRTALNPRQLQFSLRFSF